jgi:ribose-phosphate pyrophosphokinase
MPKNTIFASLKHNMETDVRIFSGSATNTLAEQIAKSYGQELGKMYHYRFSDGEFQVLTKKVFVVQMCLSMQSTMPPADNLMELLLMIDAAKRASAKEIIACYAVFWLCSSG